MGIRRPAVPGRTADRAPIAMSRPASLLLVLLAVLAAGWAGLPGAGGGAGGALGEALAHPEPGDVDGDEVPNERDNCPTVPNGRQNDADRDGQGDACDDDDDGDGRPDAQDACPTIAQDPCPPPRDTDGDGIVDPSDNMPFPPPNGNCDPRSDGLPGSHNPDQADNDRDDVGDVCDDDDDNDKRRDRQDNCPTTFNPPAEGSSAQDDFDGDGIGSACDPEESLGSAGGSGSGSGGGGSGRGSGPEPESGPAPSRTADRVAPAVSIRLARRHAVATGPRSFVVPVTCSESCALTVRVELTRSAARRLRLGTRSTVLARGRWALGGRARAFVFCDWRPRVARALRRLPARGVDARVTVVARDESGNRRTASRTVTLRR